MSVMEKKLTQNSLLKFFLVVMMVMSSNDIISLSFGMTLKPGFVLIVLFFIFSVFVLMRFTKLVNWIDVRDIPVIAWIGLCVIFCFYYGESRNYAYTFSAIVYVGMVLSAKSKFFSCRRDIFLSAFIISGVFVSSMGVVQFFLGVAGYGEYAFIRQWWYEGVIARVNGLSYEPSYYGLVVTPYLVFSFLVADTPVSYKLGNKLINTLFLLATVALIISSSRVSGVFVFIFLAFLTLYKANIFGKKVFVFSIIRLLFFILLSVVYFSFVSIATDLLSSRANEVEKNVENTSVLAAGDKSSSESLPSSVLEQKSNYSDGENVDGVELKYDNKNDMKLEKEAAQISNAELDGKPSNFSMNQSEIKEENNSLQEDTPLNLGNKNADLSVVSEENKEILPNHQSIFSGTGLAGEASHSVVTRWNDFNNTISVAKKHIVYGVGLGGVAYEIAREKGVTDISPDNVRQYEGLVPFVEISAATGVLGIFLFLLWVVVTTIPYIMHPVLKKKCSNDKLVVSFFCLAVLAQLLLMQSNQNILRMYFWVNFFIMMIFVYSSKNQAE